MDRNLFALKDNSKTDVALLAEGVDRNNLEEEFVEKAVRRPPRGGRG